MPILPSSVPHYHAIPQFTREELLDRAWSKSYVAPLRCRFYIKDHDEDYTYYTWDGFTPDDNELQVQSIRLHISEGGHGNATIRLFDDQEIFQRQNGAIRGSVIFQIGKTANELTNALYAINPRLRTTRPHTGSMYYDIECEGKIVMMDERLVNFVRHAAYATINDSTVFQKSDKMQAYLLVKELFTKEKIMPLGSYQNSIQEHGNYLLNGISEKVTDYIASIDLELSSARNVLDTIASLVGAVWRIDENNNVIFEYPHEEHTGILISGDDACNPQKLANVSFPIGTWNFLDDASSMSGFADNVIGKADNPFDFSDSSSSTSNANEKLFEQDLAQQFTITTADFSDLVMVLEKRGDPQSDLHFHIVQDNANNPTGKKIAEGTIDIDRIPEEPTPVYISKLSFAKQPIVGQLAWIILYRVEGEDDDNSIAWYHDDLEVSTSAFREVTAEAEEEIDLKHPSHTSNSGWTVAVATGHKFTYSIYDLSNQLTIAYDPRAINRFGWVDKFVELGFTSHTNTAMMIMFAYLADAARVRRTWDFPIVTIPNLPYRYLPEQWVTIHDDLARLTAAHSHTFKITSVEYLFSALGDGFASTPYGCRTCHVTGISWLDYQFDDALDPHW